MTHTFFWHDYETFGTDPRRDRPAQFAGIRTDSELNPIGEPLMWYCQPAPDYLPDPGACLITGITPQYCMQHGVAECDFAARIHAELAQPGTIGAGYNSIRFDDEVTRFLLWRNLMEPYTREWQNGCGRWDLIDVMRMLRALRPDGVVWPHNDDGSNTFRLEELARANGVEHADAHDARADACATLALARLVRRVQPRLFAFALELRHKDQVLKEMGLSRHDFRPTRPFLHISSRFASARGCLAVMWPLARHPRDQNAILCWDLAHNPQELADLDAAAVRQRVFTRAEDLPEGVQRLPLKSVHINRAPMVVGSLGTLTDAIAGRWGIDKAQCLRHAALACKLPDLSALWQGVYAPQPAEEAPDVDCSLYAGFLGDADRRRLEALRRLAPDELALENPGFDDARLPELVFRWRARNFPQSLNAAERQRWQAHCAARLLHGSGGARTAVQMFEAADALWPEADARGGQILSDLYDYAETIAPQE